MKTEEELPELENRRLIYRAVSEYPGLHFRGIQEKIGLSTGVLEYHLDYMVKKGLLSLTQDGNKVRYFVSKEVTHADKQTLAILRQDMPRRIVIHVIMNPGASFGDILEEFSVSKSTLSFHIKKLVEADIFISEKKGRSVVYKVRDPERIANNIITYRSSFLDNIVDHFVDMWLDIE